MGSLMQANEETWKLLDQGADANARNQSQYTPLHIAKTDAKLPKSLRTIQLVSNGRDLRNSQSRRVTPYPQSPSRRKRGRALVRVLCRHLPRKEPVPAKGSSLAVVSS